jgi:DNA-directed RNA polymerase subunit RPC12/RpoP
MADVRCDHCGTLIHDSATMVDHGGVVYCCANCASAVEQQGSGSDPQAPTRDNDLRCQHCGAPIADESTMMSRGDDPYCCPNCYQMAA